MNSDAASLGLTRFSIGNTIRLELDMKANSEKLELETKKLEKNSKYVML